MQLLFSKHTAPQGLLPMPVCSLGVQQEGATSWTVSRCRGVSCARGPSPELGCEPCSDDVVTCGHHLDQLPTHVRVGLIGCKVDGLKGLQPHLCGGAPATQWVRKLLDHT